MIRMIGEVNVRINIVSNPAPIIKRAVPPTIKPSVRIMSFIIFIFKGCLTLVGWSYFP